MNKKQHRDDYYGGANSHDRQINSPSTPCNRSMHPAGGNPRFDPAGAGSAGGYDARNSASPYVDGSSGPGTATGGADRWGNRDRYVVL